MKKFIVYLLYYIGDIACRISYIKYSSTQFLFDFKLLTWIGNILYKIYSESMFKSEQLQVKWKLEGPWKDFKNYCQSYIEGDYSNCCEEQCNHCKEYFKPIQS